MVVALGIVLGALAGLAWLLRRFAAPGANSGALLKVVASQSLGARERLVIVEVANEWVVLGVTAQSIQAVHTLPRQDLPPGSSAAPPAPAGAAVDFARLLARTLRSKSEAGRG